MTQTAVEYIIEQMQSGKWEYTPFQERKQIIEQANRMYQDQIETAFLHGMTHSEDYFDASMDGTRISEERNYYNETYRK